LLGLLLTYQPGKMVLTKMPQSSMVNQVAIFLEVIAHPLVFPPLQIPSLDLGELLLGHVSDGRYGYQWNRHYFILSATSRASISKFSIQSTSAQNSTDNNG